MTKKEQANQAHNLEHGMELLRGIMDFHADLNQYPRTRQFGFDETLSVLSWFEATIVDIFESPEDLKCLTCNSTK